MKRRGKLLRYTGNPNCTAVPNFHLPYLGAAHQDEVTFVLGQPNFMEDGSCCGVWGLTTDDCPHLDRCEACYAPERFGAEGYRAYFNDKEWNFARTVGTFWTNVAGSGDPNCRDASDCLPKLPWPQHAHGEIAQSLPGISRSFGCFGFKLQMWLCFRPVFLQRLACGQEHCPECLLAWRLDG